MEAVDRVEGEREVKEAGEMAVAMVVAVMAVAREAAVEVKEVAGWEAMEEEAMVVPQRSPLA